jgi:hypothetical protein
MEKGLHKKRYGYLLNFTLVAVILLLVASVYGFFTIPSNYPSVKTKVVASAPLSVVPLKNYFSYKGSNGVDAMVLLRRYASVNQDHSGMISGINGRIADTSKHEYWAFWVNGTLAQVGAADYKTKNTDVIAWKIEHY